MSRQGNLHCKSSTDDGCNSMALSARKVAECIFPLLYGLHLLFCHCLMHLASIAHAQHCTLLVDLFKCPRYLIVTVLAPRQ